MDPRLRVAVDASLAWYDAMFALHGIGCTAEDGVWQASAPPPPLHSAVKTVEPGVDPALVARLARGRGGVADSFADLGLDQHGFELLVEAHWIHRTADEEPPRELASGWSLVRTTEALAVWTKRHGTTKVLLPGILQRSSFQVLARGPLEDPTAGAVLHVGTGAITLSNVWAKVGTDDIWADLVHDASALWPARDIVGYELGGDLDAARAVGFETIGRHLVWV